jgi:hypothetical protein
MQTLSLSDTDIRTAIDLVFSQYDSEKTGKLNAKDVSQLIADVLCAVGDNKKVT